MFLGEVDPEVHRGVWLDSGFACVVGLFCCQSHLGQCCIKASNAHVGIGK